MLSVGSTLIESPQDLVAACAKWRRLEAIGVDTEFVRERTFFPALGLIQVSDGESSSLIDTLAIDDLSPLREVLRHPAVTKVLHSCGEDLEVLFHCFGEFPRGVFDTQIAAALSGWGWSLGYGRLVSAMFEVELPKDKTRTNWLRRPLSAAQIAYAALDVAYLVPAYTRLSDQLRRLDRESWVRDELEPLFDTDRFLPDPENAYLRANAWRSLAPRQLAVFRGLATWREEQARRRNLPRNFVLHEKSLVEVARRQPTSQKALSAIDSLRPYEIKRYGATLVRHVQRARDLPAAKLPRPSPAPDLRPYRGEVKRLRALAGRIAEELSLPPEIVATRRTIEKLVRRVVTGRQPVLPKELRGWRREHIGERLLGSLKELAGRPR